MTTTEHLGLTKDAETGELYSVRRVNANSDRIDAYCYENRTRIAALETGKQAALTFDSAPVQNSTNPVTSAGIFAALAEKLSRDGVLGISPDELTGSVNFSSITDAGLYYAADASAVTGSPVTQGGCVLRVSLLGTDGYIRQSLFAEDAPETVYVRHFRAVNGWTAWYAFTGTAV